MLLGFLSLLLTVFQNNVASICINSKTLDRWTPCNGDEFENSRAAPVETTPGVRRLLEEETWPMMDWLTEPLFSRRRILVRESTFCKAGKGSFVSKEGLHQLHIFIFVLACVHIAYSLLAMGLASLKVSGWRKWEDEAHAATHDSLIEITTSLTVKRQSTFVMYHTSKPWSKNRLAVWIVCFFRQFGLSVTKADYLTLRMGFIKNHNTGNKFDFHGYMTRSLEDEFQCIVGISLSLWIFVILYLLFNVDGTNLYFWLSLVPVVLVLLVGTKLQHVIATLALENAGIAQGGHFAGQALKPRDELFWFSSPRLVLLSIHFILFQNAFEMATFLWYKWQFGQHSCLLRNRDFVFTRVVLGVAVQMLCSYSTLPLYALVTQMGSHYKQAIFKSHIQHKLLKWKVGAQKRAKFGERSASHEASSSSHDGRSKEHNDSSRGFNSVEPAQTTAVEEDNFPLSALELSKVRFQAPTTPKESSPDKPDNKMIYRQLSTVVPREDGVPPPLGGSRSKTFSFQ